MEATNDQKKFIYFPSFDTGTSGNSYKGNYTFKDGTPYKFWEDTFPEKYRHKYFLLTAGHNYKQPKYIEKYKFPKDMVVFGDSGGYQIATGAIKWDLSVRETIFNWLENNSHVAMNLDIPTRGQYAGKYNECLDISKDNFKYFADKQSGKTEFLNVIQGVNSAEYSNWYENVKQFPFQGWAIGGGRNIYRLMSALSVLVNGKEHLKPTNKWLHILGISKVTDFLILAQFQRSLNEVGSNMRVTTDSSSPSRSTIFGFYYIGYDLNRGVFKYIHVPRHSETDLTKNSYMTTLPKLNEVDDIIFRNYDLHSLTQFKSHEYGALVLHNLAVFLDCYNLCNDLVYGHPYLLEQMVSKETLDVLKSIDEMVKSDKPYKVFDKYSPLYVKLSNAPGAINTIENKFF